MYVYTLRIFFFVPSEHSSFPTVSCHICTACKGQNPPSGPPIRYLCLREQGPEICCHCCSFRLWIKLWIKPEDLDRQASQLLMRVRLLTTPQVIGWDGHRIKQVSGCSLCVFKNPCCIFILWKIHCHHPSRWCWVLDTSSSLLWRKIVFSDLPAPKITVILLQK